MMRSLLVRGMLAGLVAGLLAAVFAEVFGEPEVGHAITFEEQRDAAGHSGDDHELVSRGVQRGAGLAVAMGVYGIAIGGLFAVTFAYAYGRLARLSARATSAVVALLGFVAVILVPFAKYPANPPAVGDPGTIDRRTALYFGMLGLSVLLVLGAVIAYRRLAPRLGAWHATVVAAVAFFVAAGLLAALLPGVDEVPDDFPASVLWRFRLAALGTQAVLWAGLGVVFGVLARQRLEPVSTRQVGTVTIA